MGEGGLRAGELRRGSAPGNVLGEQNFRATGEPGLGELCNIAALKGKSHVISSMVGGKG